MYTVWEKTQEPANLKFVLRQRAQIEVKLFLAVLPEVKYAGVNTIGEQRILVLGP